MQGTTLSQFIASSIRERREVQKGRNVLRVKARSKFALDLGLRELRERGSSCKSAVGSELA
jgi:hypothetical protein